MSKKKIHKAYARLRNTLDSMQNKQSVFGSYFYLKQYEELHQVTLKQPGEKLLDWGAGYGHFGFIQSQLGKEIHAYSPVEDEYTVYTETLKKLSKEGNFGYELTQDPIKLPYKDNSFDIAVSCGVLEHVREFEGDDQKSLIELYRVLRKGGNLVIGHLPNTGSWIESYSRKKKKPHHSFLYTNKEIREKATNAGFHITKHKRYGFLPKNSLAVKMLKYKSDNKLVKLFADFYYGLDRNLLSRLFPFWTQNHLLVLTKPE